MEEQDSSLPNRIKEAWPLDFWDSQEWKDVQYKLNTLDQSKVRVIPSRVDLFRALDLCHLAECKVAILAQDPYQNGDIATGVAFSTEKNFFECPTILDEGERRSFPPSLRCLYRELASDLSTEYPTSGCLEGWCSQGVLLWNTTPTIEVDEDGKPWSHRHWVEWKALTQEIVERLSAKGGIVFVFFGAKAREFSKYIDQGAGYNSILYYAHPSPRGQIRANNPIKGSRLFTTVNSLLLNVHCKEPIDWRVE